MTSDQIQIFIAMALYLLVMLLIGVFFSKRAAANSDSYFLGGRSLGPWVTAISAEASDMSGWLLMGLPGVAYWCGLADAFWTSFGLLVGTYVNWLIVAKRLRRYSAVAQDAITIPEFFSKRFGEKRRVILGVAAVFTLVFFAVYTASCFVTCGKLFSTIFGLPYITMMIVGALFVLAYTFLGGFLAVCTTDLIQGVIMIFALVVLLVVGSGPAGGMASVIQNISSIPGFVEFFGIATPEVVDGVQQLSSAGAPLFGEGAAYGALSVVSTMAWGLGYFGMPQVLVRFMAIRDGSELTRSRRIATIWVAISMCAAICIGFIGRTMFPSELLTASTAENVFILLATHLLPPLVAGVVMAGILAAAMSSADSYLLITASSVARDLYAGIFKKEASDAQVMRISRVTLLLVGVVGVIIALDENSVIFQIVSFAWAGFGATFGPLMLFSLFWKRTTRQGAIAGMLSGGIMVFVWKLLLKPMGGLFGIYELLPAFLISCVFILVVSLATPAPEQEILDQFEAAKG